VEVDFYVGFRWIFFHKDCIFSGTYLKPHMSVMKYKELFLLNFWFYFVGNSDGQEHMKFQIHMIISSTSSSQSPSPLLELVDSFSDKTSELLI